MHKMIATCQTSACRRRWLNHSHALINKFVFPAFIVCLGFQGCGVPLWSNVRPVPAEAVDVHGISLDDAQALQRGDGAETVIRVLGEPADRRPSCVPGEVVWRYPVRAWNDMANSREIVPAVLLRVSFDMSYTVTDWAFVDSRTMRALAVPETSDEASRWFQSLAQAPPPIPPRVELDDLLLRGQTTQPDVETILGQWQPDLHCGNGGPAPVARKATTVSGAIWDWYADRPSPLFVPPRYLVATFDDQATLLGWHFEQTYPGGRE